MHMQLSYIDAHSGGFRAARLPWAGDRAAGPLCHSFPREAISTIDQNFTRAMPGRARVWNHQWMPIASESYCNSVCLSLLQTHHLGEGRSLTFC